MTDGERDYLDLMDRHDRVVVERETLRLAAHVALHYIGDMCPDASEALKKALRVTGPKP